VVSDSENARKGSLVGAVNAFELVELSDRPAAAAEVYADRMYAIAFDMDTAVMEREYGNPNWRKGYAEVRDALAGHGFGHQQGSVYFGNETVTAVSCVLAAQDVARQLPWFADAVRDIRMLRIEEDNDLGVALEKTPPPASTGQLFSAVRVVE
jgi:virulence-associated protein VapD